MSQQQLQTIVEMLRSQPVVNPNASVEEARAGFEQVASMFPVDADIKREVVSAGGVKAEWVSAPDTDAGRAVLYLHGGGYVIGSINTHRSLAARLSRASKARVLVIDYRLAPEHPHPAAVDDSVAAYRWMLTQGLKPARIAVAGDSAGGGLTVATLVAIRDAKLPLPGGGRVPLAVGRPRRNRRVDDDESGRRSHRAEGWAPADGGGISGRQGPPDAAGGAALRRSLRAAAPSHTGWHGRDSTRRRLPPGRARAEGRRDGELRAVGEHDPRVAPLCSDARRRASRPSIASESSCGSRRREARYGRRSLTAMRTAGSASGETAAAGPSHSTIR